MNTFNAVTSAIFRVLLAPFGVQRPWSAWVDIILWSVLGGIVALIVYKHASNQKGIARAKNDIKVHLLEIRLYNEDILGVVTATAKILAKNALYVGHNMLPMVVMFVPMMTILFQLEATYAFAPVPVGKVQILEVTLDSGHAGVPATAVTLELPPGLALDAPPVRTAQGQIAWRLRTLAEGDQEVAVHVGDATVTKRIAVGGEPRRVPVMRTKSWEGFLYPGEEGLPKDSPVDTIRWQYPDRDLGWMPGGEGGILAAFFVLSIVAGLALKGLFGVTL
ncbi:MAG TPA: hypothetical protein VK824_11460 [Planctomycetota bacterium]|nr:hypothetical protein [Planctomycetota bacterium]